MAGHSHYANIAHKKGVVDARRGKLFSKLCRAIFVAARNGGPDPVMNLRLRYAIDKARQFSCPKDSIERAIKKATGELGGENFEEIMYEGYGPGGVAVMCEILTDNRNRTAGEVRKIFEIAGRGLGTTGCVSYLFQHKGLFVVPEAAIGEDELMEIVLEAGADDLQHQGDAYEITCDPKAFEAVKAAIAAKNIEPDIAEVRHIPSTWVDLDVESGKKMLKLRELLDDNEDVQNVFANDNIPEEVMAGA
jgi:YebC/PmpR family DNA-binding regulatory protein